VTAPKSTLRRRRKSGIDGLPATLREWFAGDRTKTPWAAMAFPGYALLPERWLAWKDEHPDAAPPAGYEWLNDPASPWHPPAWLVRQAKSCMRRVA